MAFLSLEDMTRDFERISKKVDIEKFFKNGEYLVVPKKIEYRKIKKFVAYGMTPETRVELSNSDFHILGLNHYITGLREKSNFSLRKKRPNREYHTEKQNDTIFFVELNDLSNQRLFVVRNQSETAYQFNEVPLIGYNN